MTFTVRSMSSATTSSSGEPRNVEPSKSAQFSCVVFEDMQDFGVADETGFGDFAETLDEDVIGQRSQRLGVGQHTGRRVERADEVLCPAGC